MCRQLAVLTSLMQSSPELVQQMGRGASQQWMMEVQRMEKLAELRVCSHLHYILFSGSATIDVVCPA